MSPTDAPCSVLKNIEFFRIRMNCLSARSLSLLSSGVPGSRSHTVNSLQWLSQYCSALPRFEYGGRNRKRRKRPTRKRLTYKEKVELLSQDPTSLILEYLRIIPDTLLFCFMIITLVLASAMFDRPSGSVPFAILSIIILAYGLAIYKGH